MSNKIYTEEQVKEMIDDAHNGVDGYYDILKKHNPIELPSDEEIEKTAISISDYYMNRVYFNMGVKYIINKIGGNNEPQ